MTLRNRALLAITAGAIVLLAILFSFWSGHPLWPGLTGVETLLILFAMLGAVLSIALVQWTVVRTISTDLASRKQTDRALQTHLASLQALSDIDQDLASKVSLSDRMHLLLDHTLTYLDADIANVLLVEPGTGDFKLFAQQGARHPAEWEEFRLKKAQGTAGWFAEHLEPLAIADVRASPHWLPTKASEAEDIVSFAGVPLQLDGRFIGVLNVASRTRREFSKEETDFLATLGRRVAVAIENARLFGETQRRATEFSALYETIRDLSAQQDPPTLLQTIIERAAMLLAVPSGGIYLFDQAEYCLVLSMTKGEYLHVGLRIAMGEGLAGQVARTRQPLIVDDYRTWPHRSKQKEDISFAAMVGVPMLYGGDLIGVLVVNEVGARARKFTESDVRLLSLFAAQAASAVHNARLFQETRARAQQMALLYDAGLALNSVLEPRVQLEYLFKIAMKTLHANRAEFFRFHSERQTLEFEFGIGADAAQEKLSLTLICPLNDEKNVVAWVARNRLPLNMKDVHSDPRWVREDPEVRSGIWVPIEHTSQLRGVLGLLSSAPNSFSAQDERLLVLFANQASVAMENALLFLEAKHRADQLAVINRIASGVNKAHRLDELLEVVYREIKAFVPLDTFFIALYDSNAKELDYRVRIAGGVRESSLRRPLSPGLTAHTISTQKPILIRDWEKEAAGYPAEEQCGTMLAPRSWLSVPLLIGSTVVGVICVQSYQPNAFGEDEERLLATVADQVAFLIQKAQLYEETQRRALEQSTVSQVANALNASLDAKDAFPSVVRGLRTLADCEHVSMALLEEDGEHITYALLDQPAGDLEQGNLMPTSTSSTQADIHDGQLHLNPDLRETDGSPGERGLYEAGFRSRINLPLLAGDQVIGTLNLASRRPGAFTPASLPALQQIANALAIAVQNTRLLDAEKARREELSALYDLSRALADTADFGEILDLVARRSVETLHVTFSRIALLDGPDLVLRAGHPARVLGRELGVGRRLPLALHPCCRRALGKDEPTLIHENDSDLTQIEREALFLGSARTLSLIPLRLGERVLGLLMAAEARREEREPFTPEKGRLARSIGDQAASALRRAELFSELEEAYLQTVLSLANAVDAKDTYTSDHAARLAEMALELGKEMGLRGRELEDLKYGALLHDIGKIGIPDAILQKPSQLDETEWVRMRRHPEIGAKILTPVPRLAGAAVIIRHHHERYDGTGYPDGLAGEAIPLGARILSVTDAYGAIVDRRVYKEAASNEMALRELKSNSGSQFDPRVVEAFLELLARGGNIKATA